MAEILSQEEIEALLKTISEGFSEEGKKGDEKKEKTNLGAESAEYFEQREKIKTLLHDFYQERQKNMPVHREIIDLADKLKGLIEQAALYYAKFYKTQNNIIDKEFFSEENLPDRNEVILKCTEKTEKDVLIHKKQSILDIYNNLLRILGDEDSNETFDKITVEKKDKIEIKKIIENLKNIETGLNKKVKELWDIRKNIAKELILTIPEFTDFKDAELSTHFENNGLYNLDSQIWADKIFETEKGREEKHIFFELNNPRMKDSLKELEKKYKITEEELNEIEDLKWSGEEKIKLKKLRQEVENYREKSAEIVKSFLEIQKTFKFDAQGAENIRIEIICAFVRGRYIENGLPAVHKTRAVQKIMNNTFKWPE